MTIAPPSAAVLTPEQLLDHFQAAFEQDIGQPVEKDGFRFNMTMLASRYSSGGVVGRFMRATDELARVFHEPEEGTFPLPTDPLEQASLMSRIRPYRFWVLLHRSAKVAQN